MSLRQLQCLTQFLLLSLLVAAPLFAGCSGCDDEQVGAASSGQILVTPDPIAFSRVPIGQSETVDAFIINQANDELTVFSTRLRPAGDGGSIEGLEVQGLPIGEFTVGADAEFEFSVTYTPSEDVPPASAELVFISSDDRFTREDPLVVSIDALSNEPRIDVQPRIVRFARSAPGSRETQQVVVRNVGNAPLTLFDEPNYVGGEDFRVTLPQREYPLRLEIYDPDLAEANSRDFELVADVEYAPIGNNADTGELQIRSNDPNGAEVPNDEGSLTVVDIAASADSPCIQVDSTTRNLGQVPIGGSTIDLVRVRNCGTQTLEISDVRLTENSDSNEFELDLGGWDGNSDGELDSVVRIPSGGEDSFLVRYIPVEEATDRGEIVISNNDPLQSELAIDLVARGSDGVCPVAQAGALIKGVTSNLRPSFSAAPLQYIVLDGSDSFDEDGRIVDYNWRFTQTPDGVTPQIGPVDEDPGDQDPSKRQFRLLTAGLYEIELTVEDNDGFQSCGDPAVVSIRAVPNEKILVELTWTNPEDPDELDGNGSDVDLHMVKMGPGEWFESPYDIFFRNPNNGEGSDSNGIWGPESPSLDIDDRDGAGPENIQLDDPANCEWYAVGVDYFSQRFGTAYATIRIYIDGNPNPVFEEINKPLTRGGQFWDVARIHWPSGQIYGYGNIFEPKPQSQAPDVTPGMQTSGLCTNQGLYPVN